MEKIDFTGFKSVLIPDEDRMPWHDLKKYQDKGIKIYEGYIISGESNPFKIDRIYIADVRGCKHDHKRSKADYPFMRQVGRKNMLVESDYLGIGKETCVGVIMFIDYLSDHNYVLSKSQDDAKKLCEEYYKTALQNQYKNILRMMNEKPQYAEIDRRKFYEYSQL